MTEETPFRKRLRAVMEIHLARNNMFLRNTDFVLDELEKVVEDHDREEREKIAAFFDKVDRRMGNAIRFLKFNHQLTEDDLRRAHEIRKILDEEKTK